MNRDERRDVDLSPRRRCVPCRAWAVCLAAAVGTVATIGPGGGSPAHAQIVLDGTLGAAGALAGPNYRVDASMGAIRGANLFQSFARFGLAAGERATFAGPAGIANVIARVTGGESSSIDGTVASEIAGASLFLLNPAGVVFGPNSAVQVLGGLHVSTADYLRMSDGARFDARTPAASVLSAAPPAAFGFLGPTAAAVRFEGARGREPGSGFDAGIGAAAGADFSVSAGSVALTDGTTVAGARVGAALYSFGGRVAIDAAAGTGEVALPGAPPVTAPAPLGGEVRLGGQSTLLQQEGAGVAIRGGRLVFEEGAGVRAQTLAVAAPGEVRIEGATIELRDQAEISSVAFGAAPGAALTLRARDAFTASTSLGEVGGVPRFGSVSSATAASGAAGTLAIDAARIDIDGSTLISGHTSGSGTGANVRVSASESVRVAGFASLLAFTTGEGRAGDLDLRAPRIDFEDFGAVNATAFATGAGANVRVVAHDTLRLASVNGILSGSGGGGASGSITIEGGQVRVEQGSISSRTDGAAPAGAIVITAPGGLRVIGGTIQSGTFGDGDAGAVRIVAGDVLIDGGRIESASGAAGAPSLARGRAGDVSIDARTMLVSSAGTVNASTTSAGDAGNIAIRADGFGMAGGEVYSTSGGAGRAGTITIDASERIVLADSALVRSNALDQGAAGSVRLRTRDLSMGLGARVETRTIGDQPAGTVTVDADRILIVAGGQIGSTSGFVNLTTGAVSVGRGDGGNVVVRASDRIDLNGVSEGEFGLAAGLFAQTLGAGRAGSVTVTAPVLVLGDRAQIRTDTSGAGAAGAVRVTVGSLEMSGGASIRSDSSVITAAQTTLRGDGAAGSVDVVASGPVALSGGRTRISSDTIGAGAGGAVSVQAATVTLAGGASIQAGSAGTGVAGDVTVSGADSVRLSDGASIAGEATQSNGGNVTVNARRLVYLDDAAVSTSVGGPGNGGNVLIDPQFVVLQAGGRIVAKAVDGAGGNIAIRITEGGALVASAASEVSASSQFGVDGTVRIEGPGRDLASGLRALSVGYLDAAGLVRTPCAARRAHSAGSFVVVAPLAAPLATRAAGTAAAGGARAAPGAGGAPRVSPYDLIGAGRARDEPRTDAGASRGLRSAPARDAGAPFRITPIDCARDPAPVGPTAG